MLGQHFKSKIIDNLVNWKSKNLWFSIPCEIYFFPPENLKIPDRLKLSSLILCHQFRFLPTIFNFAFYKANQLRYVPSIQGAFPNQGTFPRQAEASVIHQLLLASLKLLLLFCLFFCGCNVFRTNYEQTLPLHCSVISRNNSLDRMTSVIHPLRWLMRDITRPERKGRNREVMSNERHFAVFTHARKWTSVRKRFLFNSSLIIIFTVGVFI